MSRQSTLYALLLCCFLFLFVKTEAQTYLGLSANVGNRLNYSPGSAGLKSPVSVSGNFLLNVQEEIGNDWLIQYGARLGILAYYLKVVTIDTLMESEPNFFGDYSTVYADLNLVVGKKFPIGEKKALVGIGGGATFYYSLFSYTSYGVSVVVDSTVMPVFNSSIHSPETKIAAFVKVMTHLQINRHLVVGLEYTQHFRSVIAGEYEFYHTKTPSSGNISLIQHELSLVFLVNVSRRRQRF